MKKNQNRRRIAGAGRISDLPESERPYEKCERFGAGALSDAELLADTIEKALSDPIKKVSCGKAAAKRIRDSLSLDASCRQYEKLFES